MKKPALVLFSAIILLATVLRLYKITQNPPGLYIDEVAIGYNAYSILKTGRDEWGTRFPVLFRSFGDYKPPLYIYTVAVFEALLGPTDLAVRLPSALAGILTIVAVYFLTRELTKVGLGEKESRELSDKTKMILPFSASLLLAISPWHLQFSRAGFEANLALFFVVLGAWLFLAAMRRRPWLLLPSLLAFVASVYSYQSERLFTPLFVAVLVLVFHKKLLAHKKEVVVTGLLALLVFLPYIPTFVSRDGLARLQSESIVNESGNIWHKFQTNYLGNLSFDYLFFRGDQSGRHSVKKIGELYLWQLPIFLTGLYWLIKKRSPASILIIAWLLFGALPPAITRVSPHALRGSLMVIPFHLIIAGGLAYCFARLPRWLGLLIIIVAVYALVLYIHIYNVHYPISYAADWAGGNEATVNYLHSISSNYDEIYVTKELPPLYLLFYLRIDPKLVQVSGHNLSVIGKFYYHDLLTAPNKITPDKKSIIVAPPWMVGPDVNVMQQIKMPNGDPAYEIYEF